MFPYTVNMFQFAIVFFVVLSNYSADLSLITMLMWLDSLPALYLCTSTTAVVMLNAYITDRSTYISQLQFQHNSHTPDSHAFAYKWISCLGHFQEVVNVTATDLP